LIYEGFGEKLIQDAAHGTILISSQKDTFLEGEEPVAFR
jgi:hypothetical protein